jgi:hypothetical protein
LVLWRGGDSPGEIVDGSVVVLVQDIGVVVPQGKVTVMWSQVGILEEVLESSECAILVGVDADPQQRVTRNEGDYRPAQQPEEFPSTGVKVQTGHTPHRVEQDGVGKQVPVTAAERGVGQKDDGAGAQGGPEKEQSRR